MQCWQQCLVLMFLSRVRPPHFAAAGLKTLQVYCTGIFSNAVQAKQDNRVKASDPTIQPVWPQRKDGKRLFVEKEIPVTIS